MNLGREELDVKAAVAQSSSPLTATDRSRVQPGPKTRYLRIHAVNVFVRDQDRSLRFYLDQLGFNLAFDARLQSGQRWIAVSPPDGSAVLTLIAPDPESEQYKLIGRPTDVVFVTEDVTRTYLEWRSRGVRFRFAPRLRRVRFEHRVPNDASTGQSVPEENPIWGGVFTRFEDIDRNSFALVSFDEVSRAVEEQRRAAAAKQEAERRAAQELEIATQFQARLFPQALPPLKTLDYAGTCVQARSVGGDYYDFLDLGRDRLGLVVADVAGKGMPAALVMANLQANLRSQCAIALEHPEKMLRSANELFYNNTVDAIYASLFFAEYDDRTQRLRYANCGHLSPLVLRGDDRIEHLRATSTVLGLFKEWDCSITEIQLFRGDTILLYTDGVTESSNAAREEFGEQRLIEGLKRCRKLPPKAMLASLVDDVIRFSPHEQYDDITLIVGSCIEPVS